MKCYRLNTQRKSQITWCQECKHFTASLENKSEAIISGDEEIQNTGASASQQPLLPAGLSMPKALTIEGNLAATWKKFKRTWDNYAVVARLNRFEDEFKTATFLSCIGEDALEIFEGLDFPSEDDRKKLEVVITKFQEFCFGETNETYERFVFNSRQKKENETVDQYITHCEDWLKHAISALAFETH